MKLYFHNSLGHPILYRGPEGENGAQVGKKSVRKLIIARGGREPTTRSQKSQSLGPSQLTGGEKTAVHLCVAGTIAS